ncbi:MAG: TIGR01906 family membrane protein [Dehalococcoidia bacterium]
MAKGRIADCRLRIASLRFAFKLLLILAIPLFLVSTNVRLLLSPSFVRYEYSKDGFPEAAGFSPEGRLSTAEATIFYLLSDKGIGFLRDLEGEGRPTFNERELVHLVDVKVWVRRTLAGQKLSGLLIIASVAFLLFEEGSRKLPLYILSAGLITILAVGLIGLFAYLNFDVFFVIFHRLLFVGDSWIFAPSDALIQLVPLPFWVDATRYLALLTIGEALLLGFGAWMVGTRSLSE